MYFDEGTTVVQLLNIVSLPRVLIVPAMQTVETHLEVGTLVVQVANTVSLPRLLKEPDKHTDVVYLPLEGEVQLPKAVVAPATL